MRFVFLPLVACAALLTAACSESPGPGDAPEAASSSAAPAAVAAAPAPAPAEPCKLVMGWDPWEPYTYKDVDGNVRGLDVELAELIATTAGCDISYVEGRWGTLVKRLQVGEIDMLTGATRTEARETYALFSQPYRAEDFRLYVRAEELASYDFADLKSLMESGFHLGVTEQYAYGNAVTALQEDPAYADRFIGATISQLNYSRLLDHIIDGFLEDPFVAAATFRSRGLSDRIAAHPIAIHSGDVNLMFSRSSVTGEQLERINKAIQTLKSDGRLQSIIDKYLG